MTSSYYNSKIKKYGNNVCRYPLKRLDRDSDYLAIKVLDYTAPGLSLDVINEKYNIKTKNIAKDDNANILTSAIETLGTSPLSTGSSKNKSNIKNTKYWLYLPIPENISDRNNVSWGEDTLNPVDIAALSFGSDFIKNNPINALQKAFGTVGNVLEKLSPEDKNALVAGFSGLAYGTLGGNVSPNSVTSRASGRIFNNNMELLFNGIKIRTFQFAFDFAPRNAEESREVKKIINILKRTMSPKGTLSGSNLSGLFLSAPHVYNLEYMRGNSKHPFLNQFKPMALTDMSINYTGSNTYSTYHDGTPVHMQVGLTFSELNPIYSEDYDEQDIKGVGY